MRELTDKQLYRIAYKINSMITSNEVYVGLIHILEKDDFLTWAKFWKQFNPNNNYTIEQWWEWSYKINNR